MFEIVKVLRRGWLGTRVVVQAMSAMRKRRKRLRFDLLQAPGLVTWRIDLEPGETFTMWLPPGGSYRVGQRLSMESLIDLRPIRSRWRKIETL